MKIDLKMKNLFLDGAKLHRGSEAYSLFYLISNNALTGYSDAICDIAKGFL